MRSFPAGSDAAAVRAVLAEELGRRSADVAALDQRLRVEVGRLVAFTGGGKLLRPQFLCWGYRSVPQLDAPVPELDAPDSPTSLLAPLPAPVVRAAAALELIQACALLHDDIIDRSDTRRGQPTTHLAVAKAHADAGWPGDAAHYGVSVALLLGDLALAWADDLFADAAVELGAARETLPVWRDMRTEVLSGQLRDLRVTADLAVDAAAAERDALQVNRLKTAAYTVARPLQLGAALAGGGAATTAALRRYGAAVGLAFQLRDDQLGVFGDPAVTGKPAGGDLIEGKRTVLLARARAAFAASPTELAELDGAIGTAMTAAQVSEVTDLLARSGAPEQVSRMIAELTAAGADAIRANDDHGRPAVVPVVARHLVALAEQGMQRSR